MAEYKKHLNEDRITHYSLGELSFPHNIDNFDYVRMTEEVAAGTSTIVDQDDTYTQTYADKRVSEYGTWGDQLDEIYKDIDAWKTRIAAIKEKYPKG